MMKLRFYAGVLILLASVCAAIAENDVRDAAVIREDDAEGDDDRKEAVVKEADEKAEERDHQDMVDEEESAMNDMADKLAQSRDMADDDKEVAVEEKNVKKNCNRFFTKNKYPCANGLRYGCHWGACWRQAKDRSNKWCYTTEFGKCKTYDDCLAQKVSSLECSSVEFPGWKSAEVERGNCGNHFTEDRCEGNLRVGCNAEARCWRQYEYSSKWWCYTKTAQGEKAMCHEGGIEECIQQNVSEQVCYGLSRWSWNGKELRT